MSETPVHIIAQGAVGCGKSAVLHEIYIALKALGIQVEFADEAAMQQERNMVDLDAELERLRNQGLAVILYELPSTTSSSKVPHGQD